MDKIDRLFDAIDDPDRYSEAEINAMLEDTDLKEVIDLLDKTKSSLLPITIPDINTEWNAFESKHRITDKKAYTRVFGIFSRNIAATIAVIFLSLTAIAAVVGMSVKYFSAHNDGICNSISESVKKTEGFLSGSDSVYADEEFVGSATETIVFDNEPLETIISGIALYYGCEVLFRDVDSKSLRLYFRWNQELPVEEIVERLNNFEQIHISIEDKNIIID